MRRFIFVLIAAGILLVPAAAADPPTITAERLGPAGNDGWFTGDVDIVWHVEAGAIVTSGCVNETISGDTDADGANRSCSATTADGTESNSVTVTVKIDETDPTISSPPDRTGWNNTNVTVTWDCSLGGPSQLQSQTATATVTTEGQNQTATGTCTDGAGNSASDTVGGIDIDKTNPTASIGVSHPPNGDNGWYTSPVDITVEGNDSGGSGIASCQAGVDNYSTDTDSNGVTFTKTCTDNAGNTSAADTRTIKYDATPPNTTVNPEQPPTPTNSTSMAFQITSLDGGLTFECSLDPAPFDDPPPAFQDCDSSKSYSGLTEGRYKFRARAIDDAGNVDPTPFTTTAWTVDTSPGKLVRNVRAVTGDSRVVLTWGYPRGISRVVISRSPGGIVKNFKKPKKRWNDRSAENWQRYRYVLRTRDRAGNLSNAVVVHVRPTDPLISPRDGVRIRRKHPPLFRWVGHPRAKRYNLQLWTRNGSKHGKKVLSVFPKGTSYQLSRHWRYGGHKRTLARGKTYDWYVWPWFGSRYGGLIGQSFFKVK